MWDRKELKARGKAAFRANYWLAVLMAVILSIASGGMVGSMAGSGFNTRFDITDNDFENIDTAHIGEAFSNIVEEPSTAFQSIGEVFKELANSGALAAIAVILIGTVAVVGTFSLLLSILLMNPIQVGCQHFFIRNSTGHGTMGNLGRAFKPNWRGNVKTMFLRDLFLFLWSLLFFIPAIIKAYSYRMVPYILADHPEMSGTEVITLSRQMMNGSKWRAFVLDLSFIGWHILSALTMGILGIFYVTPYKCSTDAELYQALKNQIQG